MSWTSKYRNSGKTIPLFYYLGYFARTLIPRPLAIRHGHHLLHGWEHRPDAEYIRSRVDFYCPLSTPFTLSDNESSAIRDIRPGNFRSRYAIDAARTLSHFPADLRVNLHDGDTWSNPTSPTLIKARRLGDGNEHNSVLLNLDSIRHFQHPADNINFDKKKPQLFFRGDIFDKPSRIRFFEQWASHPSFNLGDTNRSHPSRWQQPFCSMADHFHFQFILALEGYDVASSLQWIMASQCVPVMPAPTAEGWLMHSRMEPGRHFIQIAPDFSDVGDKIEYYASHPRQAAEISRESSRWAAQFDDPQRELIISLLVVNKYLRLSGQIP